MRVASWVKTGENAGFPFTKMPAYAAFPLAPCLVYLRLSTFIIAVISTVIIAYMHRKGYTIFWLVSRLRGKLIGNRVSARPIWFTRRVAFLRDQTSD